MNYLPSAKLNHKALAFNNWLGMVNEAAPNILSEIELDAFKRYDFPGHLKQRLSIEEWNQALRGMMRGEESLMRNLLHTAPKLFVEIGCGLGTWVVLSKICGATHSIGVDIDPPRLTAAKKIASLLPKEQAKEVEFRYGNILDMQFDAPVNIFYLKATIHHLLPLDDIFEYMFNNLASGGKIYIHDPNAFHPLSQIQAFKDRGFNLRGVTTNVETGAPIPYAKEDFFTFPGILMRLKRHGFIIERRIGNLGFQSKSSDKWYKNVITPLGRNFLLATFFAQTYAITARKP